VLDQRRPGATASRSLHNVHRLDLSGCVIQPAQRSNPHQGSSVADTVEAHTTLIERFEIQRMHVVWRRDLLGELKVGIDCRPTFRLQRVFNGHSELHG
jgi:hypothetical protein